MEASDPDILFSTNAAKCTRKWQEGISIHGCAGTASGVLMSQTSILMETKQALQTACSGERLPLEKDDLLSPENAPQWVPA